MAKARTITARHDYARCWGRLGPVERDRRLTEALRRLADGDTLAQVAATWRMSGSALCRALIAYAPQEWRQALAARALVRYEHAINRHAAEPGNATARARVWATRWHLEHALKVLARTRVQLLGTELVGPCGQCGAQVYARLGRSAQCYMCGWEGDARGYVLDHLTPLETSPTEA